MTMRDPYDTDQVPIDEIEQALVHLDEELAQLEKISDHSLKLLGVISRKKKLLEDRRARCVTILERRLNIG